MVQKILVPLDGSTRAERAVAVAARIARTTGATIELLEVLNPPVDYTSYMIQGPIVRPDELEVEINIVKQYLEGVISQHELASIPTETVVTLGQPAATILLESTEKSTDLIVLCSHGYTGVTRWLMGSVAEKVARHASAPVLVLREYEEGPGLQEGKLRILVPLDGSERAELAIEPAAQLVSALSAPERGTLHLTRIVALPSVEQDHPGNNREKILQSAKESLQEVAERVRKNLSAKMSEETPEITWSVTIDDDVAQGIARLAESGEKKDADNDGSEASQIVAMTTHGHGGLHVWAMGSITERVLQGTRLPILIVRPHKLEEK